MAQSHSSAVFLILESLWSSSPSILSNSLWLSVAPPGSSFSGVLQARILRWVAISYSRGSSHRDWTQVSCVADRFFTVWATRESLWNTLNIKSLFALYFFLFMCGQVSVTDAVTEKYLHTFSFLIWGRLERWSALLDLNHLERVNAGSYQ